MKYTVWFYDCPETVDFNDKDDAIHYARLNAGLVRDNDTGETIAAFTEE